MPISEQALLHLLQHPLIQGLSEQEIHLLQQVLEEKEYHKDDSVIKAGQISTHLYLLIKGAVSFVKSHPYDAEKLTTFLVRSPNVLGESSFLKPASQQYEFKAIEDGTLVYSLDRQRLENDQPSLLNKLILNLIRVELGGNRQLPLAISEQAQREQIPEKRKQSLQTIKEEFLLRWLPKEFTSQERQEIEEIIDVKHLDEDQLCVQQKDPLHSFYLLIEGQLNALQWNDAKHRLILIDILKPGDHFGENSLIAPVFSPYTIQASHPSTILILDRKKFEQYGEKPAVKKMLLHLAQYSPDQASLIKKDYGDMPTVSNQKDRGIVSEQFDQLEFLRHHWLAEGLNAEELLSFNQLFQIQEYGKGEIIIQNAETSRNLYFIVHGQVALIKNLEEVANEVTVEKLHPRDVFGEFGFVTGRPSPISVQATKRTKVLQLPFDQMNEKLGKKERTFLTLFTNSARLMEQRLDLVKDKEEISLKLKIQHLLRQKSIWILCLLGVILGYLNVFKGRSSGLDFGITALQAFIPIGYIHGVLKDSLQKWGWAKHYINRSLIQAVICIGLIGAFFELIAQLVDLNHFHFFSSTAWQSASSFSSVAILNYFVFVVIEEWLRRGIVALSLQRGLEDHREGWAALLSALLFLGYSAAYSPLLAFALFIKDFGLALLFLRVPHLSGVILIHFILGLFFASLGWYSL